jgi:antitoxin (DNA-binding transcriptional repressor) of toxin-antitoxin stability system
MATMTIEDAQANLSEVIKRLAPGEELILTRDDQPVAKLIGQSSEIRRPVLGRGRGKLVIVSEDDEHLKGFEEYM